MGDTLFQAVAAALSMGSVSDVPDPLAPVQRVDRGGVTPVADELVARAAPDLVAATVDLSVHIGVVPGTEVNPPRPTLFLTVSHPVIPAGACVADRSSHRARPLLRPHGGCQRRGRR